MQTQWNVSAGGGPTGMVYASLPEVWRRLKVPMADRDEAFADLQVLEGYALIAMNRRSSG